MPVSRSSKLMELLFKDIVLEAMEDDKIRWSALGFYHPDTNRIFGSYIDMLLNM